MLKKLRLCIVGMGRVYNSHLPAIQQLQDKIELVALVTRNVDKGREEAKRLKIAYLTYDEALKNQDIDAVLLLLPHDLHASFSIQAMQAGKHVLVEKPMALNREEACRMVDEADKHQVTLMVGQSRRFFEPVEESIRRIRNQEIGDIININALFLGHMHRPAVNWWTDKEKIGGFIIPLWGSHIMDYVLWAYNQPPVTVYAQGYSNNPHWEGEDEAAISLQFAEGRMANILMSFNAGYPPDEEGLTNKRIWSTQDSVYSRYVIGSKGMLHLKDEYELFLNGEPIAKHDKTASNFKRQIEEFADAIRDKRAPLASGKEVLRVVEAIDAAYMSMNENRVIQMREMNRR